MFGRAFGRAFGRSFDRTSGQTSGRTVVSGARVVSGAEKKSFDRAAPASIKCDERPFNGRGLGGLCPPAKNWGAWGAAPTSQNFRRSRVSFLILKISY